MKEHERDRWEQIRAKGKRHYVIRHGVIQWGVLTALLFIPFSWLLDGSPGLEQWTTVVRKAIIALVIFPLGGIIFGLITWDLGESRYNKGR